MLREQLGYLIKLWNWSTRLGYLRTTSVDLVCFLGTRAPFGMEKLSKRLLTAKQYDYQKMRRQNTSQGLEAIITNLKFYELDKFKVLLPTSFQLLPTNLKSQEVHIRHMG